MGATIPLLLWSTDSLRNSFAWRDGRQTERLRYVFEHTAPDDPVLDGWLGTGVFRPHPLYYFFMHPELLAMLSETEKNAFLGALETGKIRPSLITVDHNLSALGPRFARFVQRNYESSDGQFFLPARARSGPLATRAALHVRQPPSGPDSARARPDSPLPGVGIHGAAGGDRRRPCPAAGRLSTPTNQDALRSALARKWLSCRHDLAGREQGDALGSQGEGIEIKPDGRYWHLARDPSGKLLGVPGVDSEGTIMYGHTDLGAVQTTFRSDLNQILVAAPVITTNPTLLIIKTDTADHRYVAADGS